MKLEVGDEYTGDDWYEIHIGEFRLARDREGLWISRDGGESMQLGEGREKKLEALIAQFWKEEF